MTTLFDDCFALRTALHAGRLPAKSVSFANSLLSQYASKGALTAKQVYWVRKLVADNPPAPTVPLGIAPPAGAPVLDAVSLNVGGIRSLFSKAAGKLKRPAIVLQPKGGPMIRLTVAGASSKFPGSVVVVSKHSKRYIGRIVLNGDYVPSPAYPEQGAILDTLKALSDDPVETAKAHGQATGACCFCNTALTDARSVAEGYGPICAKHYGLPWGAKKHTFLCS